MRPIGEQFYEDKKRKRFVIYRRIANREHKTSVRYGAVRTRLSALEIAQMLAHRFRSLTA